MSKKTEILPMNSRIYLSRLIFLLFIFQWFSTLFAQVERDDSLGFIFYEFKQSLIDLDGEKAFNFLDQETIQYYKTLLNWVRVRKEKKENVKVLELLDKYKLPEIHNYLPFTNSFLTDHKVSLGFR